MTSIFSSPLEFTGKYIGRSLYDAQKEHEEEIAKRDKDEKYPSKGGLINRITGSAPRSFFGALGDAFKTGTGASLLSSFAPVTAAQAGLGHLYHGTTAASIPGIMSTGLDIGRAGQKARFNSQMMLDSMINSLEEVSGRRMEPELQARLTDRYADIKEHNAAFAEGKVPTDRKLAPELMEELKAVSTEHLGRPLTADELGKLEGQLQTRGKRIYFASNPHAVTDWASNKTEMGIATDKLTHGQRSALPQVAMYADAADMSFLGGLGNNVKDWVHDVGYRIQSAKAPVEEMSHAQLVDMLKDTPNAKVVLKVKANHLRDIDAFADFPGASMVVGGNKGFQNLLAKALPNITPGKDISTGNSVHPGSISEVHIFDDNGKKLLKRIKLKTPEGGVKNIFRKVPTLTKMRNVGIPLTASALGAEMMLRGLTGRGLVGTAHKLFSHKKEDQLDKASAYSPTNRGIKGALLGAALGLPVLAGSMLISRKKSPEEAMANKITGEAASQAVGPIMGALQGSDLLISNAGGLSSLAGDHPNMAGLFNFSRDAMSSGVGNIIGSTASTLMNTGLSGSLNASLYGKDGSVVTALLPEKYDKTIRDNPRIGGLISGLTVPAALGTAGYVLGKHYPRAMRTVENIVGGMKGDKKREGVITAHLLGDSANPEKYTNPATLESMLQNINSKEPVKGSNLDEFISTMNEQSHYKKTPLSVINTRVAELKNKGFSEAEIFKIRERLMRNAAQSVMPSIAGAMMKRKRLLTYAGLGLGIPLAATLGADFISKKLKNHIEAGKAERRREIEEEEARNKQGTI